MLEFMLWSLSSNQFRELSAGIVDTGVENNNVEIFFFVFFTRIQMSVSPG